LVENFMLSIKKNKKYIIAKKWTNWINVKYLVLKYLVYKLLENPEEITKICACGELLENCSYVYCPIGVEHLEEDE
jgi:hypothetical protein